MATSTLKNVRFAGMATCVPKRVISNLTDCKPQLRAERERLVRNIGIETRRMAQEWQCFSDLAFDAAERLLESLEWKREEVDALIVVTQSPDYLRRLPRSSSRTAWGCRIPPWPSTSTWVARPIRSPSTCWVR